jgi:hypothetical protein
MTVESFSLQARRCDEKDSKISTSGKRKDLRATLVENGGFCVSGKPLQNSCTYGILSMSALLPRSPLIRDLWGGAGPGDHELGC